MDLVSWIFEPFASSFMQRAFISSLAIGITAPVIGVWAVYKRLVYLTDAMSHSILAGVAAAAFLGISLAVGGILAALLMALLVALLIIRVKVPEDSAIGVVGQGLFALGVIGVGLIGDPRALSHILFGNPLTVTSTDIVVQLVLSTVVLFGLWWLSPLIGISTFDAGHARSVGVRVGLLDTLLIGSLALVVVIGLTSVGVLMVITLITSPAVAARLMTQRLSRTIPLAAALGAAAAVVGLVASYHLAWPSGPTIALVAIGEVAVVAVVVLIVRQSPLRLIRTRVPESMSP
ncbi:MAG: metal ABC transporter permease [Actinobacteria bacterium]|nr:metal ABC transporter permease [Actinomycetota bacterium]